jgi:6-phosphofructokinase 1
MATILRDYSASSYRVYYGKVPMGVIANSARGLPREWIAEGGNDVTDAYIDYAMPLIGGGARVLPEAGPGGLPDFARLDLTPIEKTMPAYIPANHRRTEGR